MKSRIVSACAVAVFSGVRLRAPNRISFRRRATTRIPARWKNRSPRCNARNRRRAKNAATFFCAAELTICRRRSCSRRKIPARRTRRWFFKTIKARSRSSAAASGSKTWTGSLTRTEFFRRKFRRICRPRKFSSTASGRFWRVTRTSTRRRNTSTGLRPDADHQAAGGALGGSGGRLFPRDAPGAVGRFHLAHHRQRCQRPCATRRRLAEQSRRGGVTERIHFVENIFEELDAPGEWFLNSKTHTLYFYPPAGLDLKNAVVEATRLRTLVEFRGDEEHPVKWITLRGLVFRQAARTVMDTKRAAAAFGLGDLSRRSDFLQRRGGLRAGRQLH